MSIDVMRRLAAANPITDLPEVAPVQSLGALSEPARPAHRTDGWRWATAVAVLLAVAAGGLTFALSDGGSGPGVDVAAAAYAATRHGAGVVEASYLTRLPASPQAEPLRHIEWLQPSTGARRVRTIGTHGQVLSELQTALGSIEAWEPGRGSAGRMLIVRAAAREGEQAPVGGLALYQRIYRARTLRLRGRETFRGHAVWKLSGISGWIARSAHGSHPQPAFEEVVLVDATNYLPLVERQVSLQQPGHPVLLESTLTGYRWLGASTSITRLSAQHPRAALVANGTRRRPRTAQR